MKIVIGIIAGLVWGLVPAFINAAISKNCVKKNGKGIMAAYSILQTAVTIAALAVVVLLRNVLPFRYEGMLVGTVISVSLLGIVFGFNLARK